MMLKNKILLEYYDTNDSSLGDYLSLVLYLLNTIYNMLRVSYFSCQYVEDTLLKS